jgi:hypothetical protein
MPMSPAEKQSFGMSGCLILEGTASAPTGSYCAVQFITAGTIDSLTATEEIGYEGITFPAGFVLYVGFTDITVVDCDVVIYRSAQ